MRHELSPVVNSRLVRLSMKIVVLLLSLCSHAAAQAWAAEGFKIEAPIPYQVTQRVGYVTHRSTIHEPGGARLGHGAVEVKFDWRATPIGAIQFRTVLLSKGHGKAVDWTRLAGAFDGNKFRGRARLPAGGWYRLEIRLLSSDNQVVGSSGVEPVGVGEVFLIAGQSNAAGYSDELTRVEDPESRVVAYDVLKREWRIANDPQPHAGPGGTIWLSMCNALLPVLEVPIGLVNVAVTTTSSSQWLPGSELYRKLADAGNAAGLFRFVLWQQGESDVIKKVPTSEYAKNMISVRRELEKHWRFQPPWLLAKSTLHPTVYNDPLHENKIRAAISLLWQQRGFRRGPDTDLLAGENRGGPETRRHFSAAGQKRAGLMWFASVWNELQTTPIQRRKR